jgi:hypothetical protein
VCDAGTGEVQSSTMAKGTFSDGSAFEATLSGSTVTITNSNSDDTGEAQSCTAQYSAVFRPWWEAVGGGLSAVAWLVLVCSAGVIGGGHACNTKRKSRINAALRSNYKARLTTPVHGSYGAVGGSE